MNDPNKRLLSDDVRNLNLDNLNEDFLYHLGLNTNMNLKNMFGDVKYVCMGGSAVRAERFAKEASKQLGYDIPEENIKPLGKTERYSLFKVGPIISVNHGMGMPSISILLHEMAKLLYYAGCSEVSFIRIGTSGGIGVEAGTVIITDEALNAELKPVFEQTVLGKTRTFSTQLDSKLALEIFKTRGDIKAILGKTVGTDDFFEEQARLDGALDPGYTVEDKNDYINQAHDAGARNFEMEGPFFAAFCLRANIPAAIVCTALLDRLNGDQVTSTPEELAEFSKNAEILVLKYIQSKEEDR